MKKFLRKYAPDWSKVLINHILNRNSQPYSLKYSIFPPTGISDFFIWSSIFKKTEFVSENIYALLSGQKQKVEHYFIFYTPDGNILKTYSHYSDKFISEINLPFISEKYEYISFTHQIIYFESFNDFLERIGFGSKLNVIPQSRGYTKYFTNEKSIGACVHGNFGGLGFDNIKTAKQRNFHVYTVPYNFLKEYEYHLVFNNPTDDELVVEAKFLNSKNIKKIILKPLGTNHINVQNYSGPISFLSKLPICRPLIFQNPPPKTKNFDILHA